MNTRQIVLTLFATAVTATAIGITPALGQVPSAAQKRALHRSIEQSPATLVNPSVIQHAAEVATPPPTHAEIAAEVQPQPAAEHNPALAGAAVVAADVSHSDAVATPAETVSPTRQLLRGELAHVALTPVDEQTARGILNEQLAGSSPVQVATLQSFEGAIKQLATDNSEVQLKSYVLVGQPLQYVPETGQFVGSILVGAADLIGNSTSRALTAPLVFEVLESALADPSRVEVKQTSPPYERIRVVSRVLGQPVTIRIASNFSREGVQVLVPVEPTLLVSIDSGDLRAWGMQAARVTINAVGLKPPEGTPVQISAPGAFLTDLEPPLFDKNGVARATLRTDMAGLVTVSAAADQFAPGMRNVSVIVPWFTLLFVCLGGLVGGSLHLKGMSKGHRKWGGIISNLGVSIALGLVVFAGYVVGVKALPVDIAVQVGDTFAFFVAAVAAWAGVGFVKRRLFAAP